MIDFNRSVQANKLIDLLRNASVGQLVSYAKMTEEIGQDVQYEARHYLYTAIGALRSEGIPFGTVRGEGVQRMSAEEIPSIGDTALHHIRRTAKRARTRMQVADRMNDVPNEVRVKINANASLLGAIEHFSNSHTKAVAEEHVRQGGIVPPMKLIDALKKLK